MELWKAVKVGELGRIVTGKTPKTAIKENYGGNIPFLTPSDDMNVKYVTSTAKTLSNKGLCEVKNNLLPGNAVCVSCIGSDLGKAVITARPTVTNQQINSIIVDCEKYDTCFIYYAMLILGKELNFISKTSTAIPIINKTEFSSQEIRVPSLEVQKKIASILSALDDKIALNNKIKANLQQQADLLYNELFQNESEFCELGSVIETTSGGTPSRKQPQFYEDASILWVKSKELRGGFIYDTEEKINQIALTKTAVKLLPPHSILVAMYGATVGECGIVSSSMTCNQAICALLPNENYPYTYLYQLIRQSKEQLKNMAIGSAQQNISQVLIKKMPIHSNQQNVKEFDVKVQPYFKMMELLTLENAKLTSLRDALLPKLMSGEIDVEGVTD